MTEIKWLTTTNDPHTMAHFVTLLVYPDMARYEFPPRRWPQVTTSLLGLRRARRVTASGGVRPTERKLKLVTHACCRLVWHLVPLRACRRILELSERQVEGPVSDAAFAPAFRFVRTERRLCRAVLRALRTESGMPSRYLLSAGELGCLAARATHMRSGGPWWRPAGAGHTCVLTEEVVMRVRDAAGFEAGARGHGEISYGWNAGTEWAARAMCGLMRDIFGNPFRPVTFDPTWRTTDVKLLARHIYDARDFGAMPILADALQDAGCGGDDILNHCRDTTQVHVRGCWVLDLVLGKR